VYIPPAERDPTPFGRALAEQVAATLDQGHEFGYTHRDYCGMGLALIDGHYCYDELGDGRMPRLKDILEPNDRGGHAFTDRAAFIEWLATQSDYSLCRLEQQIDFYHGNQTVDRDRLLEFVHSNEQTPLVNLARWTSLWRAIPAEGDPAAWFQTLYTGYSEPHRHYHNRKHLNECLAELDKVVAQSRNPAALEVALWFHDVVYDTEATDNEAVSADWAADCLRDEGNVAEPFIQQVRSLILVTRTHSADHTPDADLMCDIDLAILGQSEARFAEYEEGIRQEYIEVPIQKYAKKRAEILERFLQREHIYQTKSFRDRYEINAGRNLARSIHKLKTMM
jgi:predicted metal-dependent HD superfamily phosphohydrolase